MKIEDASEHLIQDRPANGTVIAPALEPGELSVLQVESEDSLEAILAVLGQHERPVLIALPEQSRAFSRTEHFAQLKQAHTSSIVSFVLPRERVAELAPYAHEHGFHFTSSFVKAETAFLQQRYPSNAQSGALSPLLQEPLWTTNPYTPTEQQWSTPLTSNQMQQSAALPRHSQHPGQVLNGQALPSTPLAPAVQKHRTWKKRRFLPLVAIVSLLLIACATILPSLFTQSNATSLTIPPQQNNGLPVSNEVGQLVFTSSGQLDPASDTGLNDIITLNLHDLVALAPGMSYYAWLLSDKTQDTITPILLGQLQVINGQAQLTYQDQKHADLLVSYSRFLVTVQLGNAHPSLPSLDPTTWRYQGGIPDMATPGDEQGYSLLAHMRHLLAQDPTLQHIGLDGGLDIWLYRNTSKLFEWANAARDDWANNDPASIHLMIDRIVEYLDGRNYAWKDLPANTQWLVDPKAGLPGLIDVSSSPETPPSYISHVRLHLAGLINAPGHTQAQQHLAGQIDTVLAQIQTLLQKARGDAAQLAHVDDAHIQSQDALTLLNDLQISISNAYIGTDTTSGSTPGIVWVHNMVSGLTQMSVIKATPSGP